MHCNLEIAAGFNRPVMGAVIVTVGMTALFCFHNSPRRGG
jgi:hypothetical protein